MELLFKTSAKCLLCFICSLTVNDCLELLRRLPVDVCTRHGSVLVVLLRTSRRVGIRWFATLSIFYQPVWIITTRWPCRTKCLKTVQSVLVFILSKKPLTGALLVLDYEPQVVIGMYVKNALTVGMISLTLMSRFHITAIVMTVLSCVLKRCVRAYVLFGSALITCPAGRIRAIIG